MRVYKLLLARLMKFGFALLLVCLFCTGGCDTLGDQDGDSCEWETPPGGIFKKDGSGCWGSASGSIYF